MSHRQLQLRLIHRQATLPSLRREWKLDNKISKQRVCLLKNQIQTYDLYTYQV